jgi:hypothetical protein
MSRGGWVNFQPAIGSRGGSIQNRRKWVTFNPALTLRAMLQPEPDIAIASG